MTEQDYSNDSPTLQCITKDNIRLSNRQTSDLSNSKNKIFSSSTNHHMSNLSRSALIHRAPNFGTSSLFLTDYDKHEWLGSGQRCLTLKNITSNACKDSMATNEMKNGELSLFQYSVPLSLEYSRKKDIKSSFSGGEFASHCMDGVENENMGLRKTCSNEILANNQSSSTWNQTSELPKIQESNKNADVAAITSVLTGRIKELQLGRSCRAALPREQQTLTDRTLSHPPKRATGKQMPETHLVLETPGLVECSFFHRELIPVLQIANEPLLNIKAKVFDDAPSRYLRITNAPQDLSIWKVREAMRVYGDLKGIFATFLKSNGILFLEFFDVRHAIVASRHLRLNSVFNKTNIRVEYFPRGTFSQAIQDLPMSENEGILRLSVISPQLSDSDILHLLDSYGDIRSFQIDSDGRPPAVFVEYYDIRHAAFAKAVIQELHIRRRIVCQVSFYQRDWFSMPVLQSIPLLFNDTSGQHEPVIGSAATNGHSSTSGRTVSSNQHSSIYTHHTIESFVSNFQSEQSCKDLPVKSGIENSLHKSTTPLEPESKNESLQTETSNNAVPTHEFEFESCDMNPDDLVEDDSESPSVIKETLEGSPTAANCATTTSSNNVLIQPVISPIQSVVVDNRTTYMIRNIPNKYTQQMLLEWINSTHFGMYDFLYLRMDFKNRCNVGYAFINFINTSVIESFVKEHVGKKWTNFNSEKICRLSYAAIQGRSALIEKFRDSSVMNEDPSYRPKIYYTSGPETGQEEPFPMPTTKGGVSLSSRRRFNNHRT